MSAPHYVGHLGRCEVCGSMTPGGRRCEIHPAPVWPKFFGLLALVAALAALMLLRPGAGGGLRLLWPPPW